MTSKRQKYHFYHFCHGSICLDFFRKLYMYARPIQVQKKFKSLQCFVLVYDRDFTLCYRRCLNGSGLFTLFKQFPETEMT